MSGSSKSERQKRLIQYLKTAHLPVHLSFLSQRFDCSLKTMRRDIGELYYERNAPWIIHDNKVFCDQARNHAIEMQSFWFAKPEMESLFALNQIIEQLAPSVLKNQLEPFKHRIQELLSLENQSSDLGQKVKLIEMAGRQVDNQIFQKTTQALIENKRLHIQFWNRYTDEMTNRTISPQKLIRYRDNWLVDAYCHLRKKLRSFSLEAIQAIELLDDYSASHISDKELQKHYESSYGIYAGAANKTAVLKFSPYLSRWIQFESWHPEQVGHWDIEQCYQLQLPYHDERELIQDILKYGSDVEVLEPLELRKQVQKKLNQALQIYSGTGFVPEA